MTIRYCVANHPKTSNETLKKMLKDKECSVSSSAEIKLNSRKNVNNKKSLIRKFIKKIRELY